jgi:hypothetical protein
LLNEWVQEVQLSELVSIPLQEQHWYLDIKQMLGPLRRRLTRRMQREAKEYQPAHARQRRSRLGLRRHSPAERFASSEQWQAGSRLGGVLYCRPNRRLGHLRIVGPFGAVLHIEELIAQRRDASLGEAFCDLGKECVLHPGTSSVRENIAGAGTSGDLQQRRYRLPILKPHIEGLRTGCDVCARVRFNGSLHGIRSSQESLLQAQANVIYVCSVRRLA